ncbi:Elongator complex protein 5 [Gamsiella multidivaricata]|uniref:Elongator complex protein 5 n=1 Tax=Gamsiella multidivaricata TaxID=101098 RepID=UPI002220DCCE|nr:Elongator complex protein 5 [Gamsiella multidivaricata]KAI7824649.1 Elongator complex protein 5 [Gamsiella multidivaricata]
MAPILEKILTGKETSPFILVKDTLEQSGQVLGLELLGNTPTDHTIVLVCAETAPDRLLSLVKGSHLKVIVDCYSNPLGWTDTYQASISKISSASGRTAAESHVTKIIPTSLRNIRRATKVIMELISSQNSNFTVYFDSLSQFLIASVPDTFNLIRSITGLLTDTSRIIAVYHEDVPDADSFFPDASKPFAANGLAHIATTLITLTNSEALRQDQEDLRRGMVAGNEFCYLTVHGNAWDSAICEIEHKRKSGKVARETNAYHLESPTGELVVVNVWDVVGEMPDIEKLDLEESQTADPAANLSFNLNLTEEQRRAKNDTVLPYLKTQESTGAIYYEPDKGDDFDDDDPDDDLTI